MKLVRSPNRWSCLAASFATVLDLPLELICKAVGHDGGDVIWPTLPEPERRRGFHIQEMVELAFYSGFFVVPFEPIPVSKSTPDGDPYVVEMAEGPVERMSKIMTGRPGVITGLTTNGHNHAIAWDGANVLDPGSGDVKTLDDMYMDVFFLVSKRPLLLHEEIRSSRK